MSFIDENIKKNRLIKSNYDQFTGEGCVGERVKFVIKDAPITTYYLPVEMMEEPFIKEILKHGSIANIIIKNKKLVTEAYWESFWIMFCELRYYYDFEFYAITCLTIQDKLSGTDIRFKLNRGQRRLLDRLERMRKAGVPIRIILLKARQWGGSTLIQLYMNWIQMIQKKNWSSVICAHVKDAAINIRAMYEKVINNIIQIDGKNFTIRNFAQTQNIKHVPERGCRITVGSAEEPDSVRSQDAKMAHFSEVGIFPNTEKKKTEDLISSITGTIPAIANTLIAYESTAKGVGDFFHTEWEKAMSGESVFDPVFVPWYLIDMYSTPFDGTYFNSRGRKVKGTINDFAKTLDDYERNLFINHPECTLENINWYRFKKTEMTSHAQMKQEFPSDHIEAFQDSGMPVFRSEDVENMRNECCDPDYLAEISSDCSPSAAKLDTSKNSLVLSNVRLHSEAYQHNTDPASRLRTEMNKLKIWVEPYFENISNRYVVVVDTGGRSVSSDYSVIVVFDRYWMMYGGVPEVVAEWRGHIDHDILVWVSAMIAKAYDNALLVIESNTHETERNEGQHGEFIFDTLASHYSNMYSRTPADKIINGIPAKYGFHTNKSTKTMIIDNYVAVLRVKGYKERSQDALNEARVYEKKKNGEFGAKEGKHDDILMTRMIGCYICYDLPLPKNMNNIVRKKAQKVVGSSSF